jgi:hypothetical protein
MMLCFAFANLLQLTDKSFAVRSLDYPEVEGRGSDAWSAREQFRQALEEYVHREIDEGRLPTLFDSVDDMKQRFPGYSKKYLDAADRRPKSSDVALIIPVELASDTANALQRLSSASLETVAPTSSAVSNDLTESQQGAPTNEAPNTSQSNDSATAAPDNGSVP